MARRTGLQNIHALLDAISAGDSAHLQPGGQDTGWDAMSEDEKLFEARKREQLIRQKDEEIRRLNEIHDLRKSYLRAAFVFVSVFSIVSISLVALCGRGLLTLADGIIVTLLTTTMANVLGVLYIAFNWLFPKPK